jgi:hypothetical protein
LAGGPLGHDQGSPRDGPNPCGEVALNRPGVRDVNITSDLKLEGANTPETVKVGDNILVAAIVDKYEASSCVFLLKPVSTQYR